MDIDAVANFLVEMDQLKSVYRQTLLTDCERHENSAEHSWHITLALVTLNAELDLGIDIAKAVKMALVHDICEIGAGDISVFAADRSQKEHEEREYVQSLRQHPVKFITELESLWEEYEAQESIESHWVKVVDRVLPFMLNLETSGKTWKAQGVRRSQVIAINQTTKRLFPGLYDWMLVKIDEAVLQNWLLPD